MIAGTQKSNSRRSVNSFPCLYLADFEKGAYMVLLICHTLETVFNQTGEPSGKGLTVIAHKVVPRGG